jgi:hypothetical protein
VNEPTAAGATSTANWYSTPAVAVNPKRVVDADPTRLSVPIDTPVKTPTTCGVALTRLTTHGPSLGATQRYHTDPPSVRNPCWASPSSRVAPIVVPATIDMSPASKVR